MNFADRLLSQVELSSPLVLGIDPNFELMPSFLVPDSTADLKDALLSFSIAVMDACDGLVPAVKIQSAYFEQFGTPGVQALAEVLKAAKQKGLVTILDVKRGDIGSTSTAYALGYLQGYTCVGDRKFVSDLEVDCVTINPFMGRDSIEPFVDVAKANNKGLFVLVKTSNPGSKMVMDLQDEELTVSEKMGRLLEDLGTDMIGDYGFHSIGAVVGATALNEVKALREAMPNTLFLMPGIGAQGGSVDLVKQAANQSGLGVIVPISRGITYPKAESHDMTSFQNAVRQAALTYVAELKEA